MHIYFKIFKIIYGPTSQRDFHDYYFCFGMDCIWQTQQHLIWMVQFILYGLLQWIASGKPSNMDLDGSIHFIWVASMDCIWQTQQHGFGWFNSFYMGCFNGLHLANPPVWVWMIQFIYMGCFNGLHLANPPAWVWMVQSILYG